MKNWWVLFVFVFSVSSCKDSECSLTSGDYAEMEILVDEFMALDVSDFINIELIQTNEYGLLIKGGENIINNIQFEVRENTLFLRNENQCRWLRDPAERIDIQVFAPDIKAINFPGYGDVVMEDWEINTLTVRTLKSLRNFEFSGAADSLIFLLEQGSPDLYLTGSANYLYLYHSGTGKVVANELKTNSIHLNHISSGNFHVFPINDLLIEIRANGNTIAYHPVEKLEIIQEGRGKYIEEF